MIHISELLQLLEQWEDDHSFQLKWISPEEVTGLDRNEIFRVRETEDWTSETDLSEKVFKYVKVCYDQGDSCLGENASQSLTELYVRAMTSLIVEYDSSLAAVAVPREVEFKDARNCLPIFVDALLNRDTSEYARDALQQYVCDFYQFDDLWEPPEGKFHKELTTAENMLVAFLGNRILEVDSLRQYGVPKEIMPFVANTKLIKKVLEQGATT